MFTLKQGWACLFGGLLLIAINWTKLVWQPSWPLHRCGALFLRFGLETSEEARVILLFHQIGTAMEWFKVATGS